MAPLVLYFLAASRSIRIAWLLEELGLDYRLEIAPRENNRAPADFKAKCGSFLGKFPVLRDGDLLVVESGAITEYVIACEFICSLILVAFLGMIVNRSETSLPR